MNFDKSQLSPYKKSSSGKGKGKSGQGEDGKDGKPSDKLTPEDIEENEKKQRGKTQKSSDESDDKSEEKDGKDGKSTDQKGVKGGPGSGQNGSYDVDWSKQHPKFGWQQILAKLIKEEGKEEDSYMKQTRRNTSNMHTASQEGVGAIAPGQIELEGSMTKLAIVIDSSGSMNNYINTVYAEVFNLLKKFDVAPQFVLIKFSESYQVYMCQQRKGQGKYKEIKVGEKIKTKDLETGDIKQLFNTTYGSSTNFYKLEDDVKRLLNDKFSVLVISDTDIVHGPNLQSLVDCYKHNTKQFYVIFTSHEDWVVGTKAIGGAITSNLSHM